MAISMKDLQSSLYEDLDEEYNAERNIELNTIPEITNSDTNSLSPDIPKQSSKGEESKALWIKGQVSESFKRLSTRISPVSLDNSFSDSIDEDSATKPKLTKMPSESDKYLHEHHEPKDNPSKKQWIKGHINNYITKSKRLYQSRNEHVASTDKKSPHNSPNLNSLRDSSDSIDSNASVKVTDGSIPPSPLLEDRKLSNTTIRSVSPTPIVCPTVDNDSTQSSDQHESSPEIEPVPSKLTFSELLNSDCSTCSDKGDKVNPPKCPDPTDISFSNYIPTCEIISEEEEINNLTDIIIKEDLQYHLRPGEGTSVTFFNIWICSCFTCVYFLCNLPPYLFGVITGSVCTYLVVCSVVWLLCPSAEIYDTYQSNLKSFLRRSMRPESVKPLPKLDGLLKPKDLKGWISLAYIFHGMYDKDLAKDVFSLVHNEAMYIFLCKINESETVKNTEKKRKLLRGRSKKMSKLMAEQQVPIFTFECVCQIDLCECSLSLKPDDLCIRRIWNKKYPMELLVPKGKLKRKNINLTLEELTLTIDDMIEGGMRSDLMKNSTLNEKEETFYLFGNTGREKEDWFYRLQLCIAPLKHQVTVKDYNENKLSKKPSDSYPHYMTELIKESEKVMQRTANGKKMEPYLAWLNIFLGRAFWDFWHESVWEQKLHNKIQTRLSKLNTPPFITDIKLKDLNCGHNIPIIHKGSMPVLDEHGIWSDLQVSYKGYFTLTLETQLNIDYYVDLVTSIVKQKADPKENVQLSKIKSGLNLQDDDSLDDSITEKEMGDPDGNNCDVDDESVFHDEIQDVFSDAFENTDIPALEADIDPVLADPRTKAFLQSRTGKKVVSLVGWLAKSKIAKRVAETDFAKKAYERAYKKFQKMPIVLKVEIQSLKGNVAVNIPPPPTNRLWYGFRGNPVIFITASPKVGDKQVRLTYLTNWIERKLKEEFKKFLVLPNMQDISIKLMDSHILDLTPDRPDS